jgi:perosamine synthetase
MLRLADPRFGPEALDALERVLRSGTLTQGPVVAEFEVALAAFTGARHAVATTSATAALGLALAALDIGAGDEVVVTDFTYPATGNAVLARGATVRLADVDADTYCLDAGAVRELLGPRTKAVVAVDVFGLPADYAVLEPLLAERGVPLVCDAACSLGGAIEARRTGTFGLMSCFSFHPRKSLTTGEGGLVTTDDDALAARMRRLRDHGAERGRWRATFVEPGFNLRMSDLNAALGLVQVPGHAETVRRRRVLAARLTEGLAAVGAVTPQAVPGGHLHPYQAYVVTCADGVDRDALVPALRARGIEATLGTYAMHAEPAFQRACGTRPGDLPRSAALAARTLALPLHQRLSEDDVDVIADAVAAVLDATPVAAVR